MIYRPVKTEWQDTHYYNLAQGAFLHYEQPKPGQMDIRLLDVYDCPIKKTCASINRKNITVYCKHLKLCTPEIEEQKGQTVCDQTGRPVNRKIKLLKTFIECPISELGCIIPKGGIEKTRRIICDHLKHITSADSSRPHYQITCEQEGKS